MQKLNLSQVLSQKLSPQQIQFIKLLQVPTAELETRVEEELEINPALEEGKEEEKKESEEEDFENNYEEVLGKGYIKEHEFEYEGELPVYASSFGNNSNGDFWLWFFLIVFGVILYFGFKKMSEKKIGKSKRESKKKKSNE